MSKTEAVKFFGSKTKLAKAIGRAKQTISHYNEKLPRGVQYEIAMKSQGQLAVDPEYH